MQPQKAHSIDATGLASREMIPGWQVKDRADSVLGQEASKGRAASCRKLPEAACWGWIQALVAEGRRGLTTEPASPHPELIPGVEDRLEDGLPHPALLI